MLSLYNSSATPCSVRCGDDQTPTRRTQERYRWPAGLGYRLDWTVVRRQTGPRVDRLAARIPADARVLGGWAALLVPAMTYVTIVSLLCIGRCVTKGSYELST